MNLQTANVDDATAPSGEVVAIAPALDDIARIDESLRVEQRVAGTSEVSASRARRSDVQRIVPHFEGNAVLVPPKKVLREPSLPISDLEGHASFGRRECMRDPGLRKRGLEMVENRLVRDLARQSRILRRDGTSHGTHERATPVRRRSGNVCDAV